MAHFSNQVQFKVSSGMVRLSFRLHDQCVIEHLIPIEDFKSIIHTKSDIWEGFGVVQAKKKDRKVLIRVLGTPSYVYSIASRTFSELSNEFLSRGK